MLWEVIDSKVRSAIFSLVSVGFGAILYLKKPWAGFSLFAPADWPVTLWVLLAMLAIGIVLPFLGGFAIKRAPVAALFLFEMRAFWVLALLAVIVAAGLLASGVLATSEQDPADLKASMSAVEKAVTAVFAALAVAIAGEKSSSATALLAQRKFQEAFKGHAATRPATEQAWGRMVEHAVFSDPFAPSSTTNRDGSAAAGASGWGWDARWARARAVAANLA
ncbi:MAG: hypothetical protein SWN98_02735 [Pseudomonadota bacterium]|nr:hypothetical protein [Pseudomonadota bacterium]